MGKKVRFVFLLLVIISLQASFFAIVYTNARYPVYYKNQILKSSYNHNIEPYVVASLISVESSYRKGVVSNKGAVGLMQILPSTANWISKELGVEDFDNQMLFEPETNIEFGTFYLSYLLNKFKNLDNAICAYNAGEGVVSDWLKIQNVSSNGTHLENIPFSETKNHLQKFKKAAKQYRKKYKNFNLNLEEVSLSVLF